VGWLVKGGGAQTREKIVAAAATRYVGIVSSNKMVESPGSPSSDWPSDWTLRFEHSVTPA
jgi:hypothetical protein